ncbi:MAG TPA: LemA family protein, partial [Tepidisphaeraceae bacterium]|nr:LemA family protein [Tepidisphaeraceae bacterium]
LVCLAAAYRYGRRRRLVDDLPTSKTTGVFIGLVELSGSAEIEFPVISYLAGAKCVYTRYDISERWSRTVTETYRDAKGNTRTRTRTESGWTSVASGMEMRPFYLRDDRGAVRVDPAGAKIEARTIFNETVGKANPLYYDKGPRRAVAHSTGVRLFTESAIVVHDPIYVIGQARERSDIVAPEIAEDPDAPMFLISTRAEDEVSRRLAAGYRTMTILAIVLAVAGFVVADLLTNRAPETRVSFYAQIAASAAAAAVLGWLWLAINSLVDIKNRVMQAWSLIDIQLKRRHDLIPNLVSAVQGYADYEKSAQQELALLRTQALATPPGQPGPDPRGVTPTLRILQERYPELNAQPLFARLADELIDTEQRIALARAYYNDIATFRNIRLQRVPDVFIATLLGHRRSPLLAADGFERQPVQVTFAD